MVISPKHKTTQGVATVSWSDMPHASVGEWIVPQTGAWTVHVDAEDDGSVVELHGSNAGGTEGAPLLDRSGLEIRLRHGQLARIDTPTLFVRPVVRQSSGLVHVHLCTRAAS